VSRIVKIGAATAFFNDSRMGIAQLLEKAEELDYVIFDFLAESVMGGLGRGLANQTGQGFAADGSGSLGGRALGPSDGGQGCEKDCESHSF